MMTDDHIDRVARAIVASDEANRPVACACSGKESPEDFACSCDMYAARRRAKVALETTGYPTLVAALRTIHEAIPKFLHPTSDMTNQEFIGIVLGAVDNATVNKALEKGR